MAEWIIVLAAFGSTGLFLVVMTWWIHTQQYPNVPFHPFRRRLNLPITMADRNNTGATVAPQSPDDLAPIDPDGNVGDTSIASVDFYQAPSVRQHTAITGKTGDGKTTTTYTMLARDIAAGASCVVASTHFTYYHPEDQQIDLRPLASHFEVAYTHEAIRQAFGVVCGLIDQRLNRYRRGEDVGNDVCLYLGEWGNIRRVLGSTADDMLLKILDEGRKTKVWVAGIELHSALINRLGGDSGLREAFKTRLVGNIDDTTWRVFVGRSIERRPVPKGCWMTADGLVSVERPTATFIQAVAETIPPALPLLPVVPPSDDDTSDMAAVESSLLQRWTADHIKTAAILAAKPTVGQRELARLLWPSVGDGGGSYGAKAKRLLEEVRAVTDGVTSVIA